MSVEEIHVGDAGTLIQATILDSGTALDISAFTTKLFYLKDASGVISTITAIFIGGSGTGGVIGFTSTAGTFGVAGRYQLQAYLAGGTNVWRSDIYEFTVFGNVS